MFIQAVADMVKYKLSFAEIEQGRPATVKDAAMAFKDTSYEYREETQRCNIRKKKKLSCDHARK
jgi:hypothetical protein